MRHHHERLGPFHQIVLQTGEDCWIGVVEVQDVRAHHIWEVSSMRHHHERLGPFHQVVLQTIKNPCWTGIAQVHCGCAQCVQTDFSQGVEGWGDYEATRSISAIPPDDPNK